MTDQKKTNQTESTKELRSTESGEFHNEGKRSFVEETLAAFHRHEITAEEAETALLHRLNEESRAKKGSNILGLLGYFAKLRNDLVQAESFYSEAYARNPRDKIILAGYATVLLENGKLPEALSVFKQAVELKPDNSINLSNAGMVAGLMGLFEEAEEFFRRSLGIKPNDTKTLTSYATLLLKQDKFSEAETELRKAQSLNNQDPIILGLLTKLYVLTDQYAKASETVTEALKLDPQNRPKVQKRRPNSI